MLHRPQSHREGLDWFSFLNLWYYTVNLTFIKRALELSQTVAMSSAGFHDREGQQYCQQCFLTLFASRCQGCSQPILENYISALNSLWHPQCFVCRVSVAFYLIKSCSINWCVRLTGRFRLICSEKGQKGWRTPWEFMRRLRGIYIL